MTDREFAFWIQGACELDSFQLHTLNRGQIYRAIKKVRATDKMPILSSLVSSLMKTKGIPEYLVPVVIRSACSVYFSSDDPAIDIAKYISTNLKEVL